MGGQRWLSAVYTRRGWKLEAEPGGRRIDRLRKSDQSVSNETWKQRSHGRFRSSASLQENPPDSQCVYVCTCAVCVCVPGQLQQYIAPLLAWHQT